MRDERSEVRDQRAEDGGQKTEDGGQRTEGTPVEHPKGTRFNWVRRTESTRLEREKVRKEEGEMRSWEENAIWR